MRIVAGLGNPGSRYASHRHNVGFMMVDQLADHYGFSLWKDKFGGQLAEGRIGNSKTLLFKPQSYMNRSGLPVAELMKFYKESSDHLTVIHDEIDLAAGKIRVKMGGGHGGHNGLRDIDRHLGPNYWRLRVGVGRSRFNADVDQHVLSDFDKADKDWLNPLLECMTDLWTLWDSEGHEAFMTAVAHKTPAPTISDTSAGNTSAGNTSKET
ncbi:aminoacyl-tRNA hydrolase [Alphaproteobacteria bacterium]|nr:aminoacyl-tRNA hydrolase [Alphaproteobacteria bacterium]